ncbi:MAG: heparan N-sulfatase [Gammaproteobacteria bacterium]|nr:MAG: heparan N-sulfatase [Gammaproteobacteria bacterium]
MSRWFLLLLCAMVFSGANADGRPNILLIVSDDQSWPHTSFAGYPAVRTPHFDQLASQGVYFERAYVAAPTCAASRASILTGRHIWGLESAALLWGYWPEGIRSYQDMLEASGYHVGYTGKPWGPGYLKPGTRDGRDPTGTPYVEKLLPQSPAWRGVWDLAANLDAFLEAKPEDAPFSFFMGVFEPHRPFPTGNPQRFNLLSPDTFLPPNLPNTSKVREGLAAYLQEIEVFDRDLGAVIDVLRRRGEIDNTLIVLTSDNGMDFPRAKPTNYEYGVRVPLAMVWPKGIDSPGRVIHGVVGLVDLMPTFLDLAGIHTAQEIHGSSLLPVLKSGVTHTGREAVFSGYERHAGYSREFRATYPRRVIHTPEYVLIRNYFPDRWPFGDPPHFRESNKAYLQETDGLVGKPIEPYFSAATAKKPYEELYVLAEDPAQFLNRIDDPALKNVRETLQRMLDHELQRTHDPVHVQRIDYFQQFEYLGPETSPLYPVPGTIQ